MPYFLCSSNFSLSDKCAPYNQAREHEGSERGLLHIWERELLSELHHFSYGCDAGFFCYPILEGAITAASHW